MGKRKKDDISEENELWTLSILFQVISGVKTIWMLEVRHVLITVAVVRSAVILLQCLLQG